MGVTAGIFLASILLKEMRYLVYIRYLCRIHRCRIWAVRRVIQPIRLQNSSYMVNLVSMAFCFRGWMVSEKGPGFRWSVLQPDWSMILNVIIQYKVGIIIILVEREWSDKFIGKDNISQNNLVQIKSLYILYRRVFALVQHTFLTCVVYTSLISRNVQSYSQIKIVIRINLFILNTIYVNQTLKRFGFV
jgi:hypothetical protein